MRSLPKFGFLSSLLEFKFEAGGWHPPSFSETFTSKFLRVFTGAQVSHLFALYDSASFEDFRARATLSFDLSAWRSSLRDTRAVVILNLFL